MSIQYDEYLEQHRGNVKKAYAWLRENLPEITKYPDIEFNIIYGHDNSKNNPDEYDAYDAYFYGNNKSYSVVENFKRAWLTHIHNNKHHWQYWVLINDDPNEGEYCLDMPYEYIVEMICDWWAFSWKSGNLIEIFDWYEKHSGYIKLSYPTRKTVETILDTIHIRLMAQ